MGVKGLGLCWHMEGLIMQPLLSSSQMVHSHPTLAGTILGADLNKGSNLFPG